jgi:hypothetical protein
MMKHPRKIPYEDTNTAYYGLWLVKDNGIYVTSPSDKRDMDGDRVHVIYADGYDRDQEDIWDKTYAVSSDDFIEFIPLNRKMVQRLIQGGELKILLSATKFEVHA